MGFTSRTCILILFLQLLNLISAQEVLKRAPQGFLGVRGKKYNPLEDNERYYKRKPQFFVGVKGKKIWSLPESFSFKRAPMGFVGMRGKKDAVPYFPAMIPDDKTSLIGLIDYSLNDDILKEPQTFPLLQHFLNDYLDNLLRNEEYPLSLSALQSEMQKSETDRDFGNEIEKRAANMNQFYGVRGKKSLGKRPFDLSFRGKFIGVRGKKDIRYGTDGKFSGQGGKQLPKRKSHVNGFFGMRGKKWSDDAGASTEVAE